MDARGYDRIYPDHIYDPLRIKIAAELVEKELSKLMPARNVSQISEDVRGWWERPKDFKLAEVIDFWDAVEAIVGGVKLKSITMSITAANYNWSAAKVHTKDLVLVSKLEQLDRLPGLSDAPIKLSEVESALKQNPAEMAEQKCLIDSHTQNKAQDAYRIIGGLNEDASVNVQDGNRRALRALLYGQEQIDAWVYESHGQAPKDYWIPVSFMLNLVKMYRHNKEDGQLTRSLKVILAQIFQESSVAKISYQHRIINSGVKGAEELLQGND